jgi:hypothetical protein
VQYLTFLDRIIEMCDGIDENGETTDKLLADVYLEARKRRQAEVDKQNRPRARQPRKRPRGVNNG